MHRTTQLTLAALLPLTLAACRTTPSPTTMKWEAAGWVAPGGPGQEAEAPPQEGQLHESAVRTLGDTLPTPERFENIYRKAGLRFGGVAYSSFNTTARITTNGAGGIVDFEDLLGVDSSLNVARADAFYAFNDTHQVDVGYYDLRRTGRRTLTEEVHWGGTIIKVDEETTSKVGTQILKLAYRYNFVTDARVVLGGSFGLHTMKLDLGIRSTAGSVEESFGVTAPLPLFGLHGTYALSRTWSLYASGEILKLEIDNYGGTITDFRLGLDWDVFEHIGLGIELNAFNLAATLTDGPLSADLEYGYSGLGIYLRGYL